MHGQEPKYQYRAGKSHADNLSALPKALPAISGVLQKEEPGVAGGDFRAKLQRTTESKIDTKAAFPSQKMAGAQMDFRNVLKKTSGPEKKVIKSGSATQTDFRTNLRKTSKVHPIERVAVSL